MSVKTTSPRTRTGRRRTAAGPKCVVCGSPSVQHMVLRSGELRRCSRDGLIFAWPLELPASPTELFSQAYSGGVAEADMRMFHHRLVWRADLLSSKAGAESTLAPVHRHALSHIRANVPAGERALDIGCGSGIFLEALRRAGYDASGIEVAAPVVKFLERSGFDVFHGTVDDVPEGTFDPVVCTSFFVLHHVTDPVSFLRQIRSKFPRASLILSEHYFGEAPRNLGALNLPPRRLTAWNPASLALALEKAGFAPRRIEIMQSEPYHPSVDTRLMEAYCRLRGLIPPAVRPALITGYIVAKRNLFGALSAVFGGRPTLSQEHLLAIAEPA